MEENALRFENRLHIDERRLRTLMKRSPRRRTAQWAVRIAAGIAVTTAVLTGFTGRAPLYVGLALLLCLYAQWNTRRLARKIYTTRLRQYAGVVPQTTVRFTEQGITLEEAGRSERHSYASVLRAERSDDTIILRLKGRQAILMAAEGFTAGAPAAFAGFLAEKAPQAKIKL